MPQPKLPLALPVGLTALSPANTPSLPHSFPSPPAPSSAPPPTLWFPRTFPFQGSQNRPLLSHFIAPALRPSWKALLPFSPLSPPYPVNSRPPYFFPRKSCRAPPSETQQQRPRWRCSSGKPTFGIVLRNARRASRVESRGGTIYYKTIRHYVLGYGFEPRMLHAFHHCAV